MQETTQLQKRQGYQRDIVLLSGRILMYHSQIFFFILVFMTPFAASSGSVNPPVPGWHRCVCQDGRVYYRQQMGFKSTLMFLSLSTTYSMNAFIFFFFICGDILSLFLDLPVPCNSLRSRYFFPPDACDSLGSCGCS